MNDQYTFDAAPYVLGALSEQDRLTFEAHLADCPACAAEVLEFSDLPGLLAQLPADDPALTMTDEQLEPPATLLPALLFSVRRERRQRRWRARQRRHRQHALGGSGALTHRPVPRRRSAYERLCA